MQNSSRKHEVAQVKSADNEHNFQRGFGCPKCGSNKFKYEKSTNLFGWVALGLGVCGLPFLCLFPPVGIVAVLLCIASAFLKHTRGVCRACRFVWPVAG